MNNNQFSPNAISHKQLNILLKNAKKELTAIETSKGHQMNDNQEFNELISNWEKASQKILLMLSKKEKSFMKHTNQKSLLAYGAMGAHINMALQALKATESDQ